MRLRVEFGLTEYREATWDEDLSDFPKLIKFNTFNHEWIVYDRDITGKYDYILKFSALSPIDADYHKDAPSWEQLFGYIPHICECGSEHFPPPRRHMFYCKMYRKW